MNGLELWGGLECTVNRVGDIYRDQFADSGHDRRLSDLDRAAELGIRTLRYPVLWEHVSPDSPDWMTWDRHDLRLARIRQHGIRMIAGLVHHGSGPRYTNLLADDFAAGLARHARHVAERYDWIEDWTPVNEPVTTARFSALYGHWYPHHRDERSFWIALLNQIDGVRLAMRQIRRVNPGARLIQTDDLGRTYATAAMRDQAAFDNVRRWMGWDLLMGRVTPDHPFWQRLCDFGFGDRLRAIADDPCPPDIIGVNHYLTSDRFLDHRVDRYPEHLRGSNGVRAFVDTEGVRTLQPPPAGLSGVLREAWARYGTALAVTEVHNGCTREEQLRWTYQAWRTAQELRRDGIDLRAITAWALFGSCSWNTLLTKAGTYEPGAFDVRGTTPRPTALAGLLATLAGTGSARLHPVLAGDGWWCRPIRLHHAPVPRPAPLREHGTSRAPAEPSPPMLIVGADGMLGGALAAACRHRNLHHVAMARAALDPGQVSGIAAALDTHRPWVVINAVGSIGADGVESDAEACFGAQREATALLNRLSAERKIPTIAFSTDQVPDGSPAGADLVIRTATLFTPFDPRNFAMRLVAGLRDGRVQRVASDEPMSPTYVPDLCDAVLDLAIDGEGGCWHLSGGEVIGRAAFAGRLATACGLDPSLIVPTATDLPAGSHFRAAPPPLPNERGQLLPPLADAIARFANEVTKSREFEPAPVQTA